MKPGRPSFYCTERKRIVEPKAELMGSFPGRDIPPELERASEAIREARRTCHQVVDEESGRTCGGHFVKLRTRKSSGLKPATIYRCNRCGYTA